MKIVKIFLCFSLLFCLKALAQQPIKKVLLEEFSTAPCGFCPDGGLVAEEILKKYSNVISFTHHAGFGTDSMTIPESKTIANEFTTFAPGACIDRGNYPIPVYTYKGYIAVSRQKWDSLCYVRSNDTAFCGVSISNTYNATTRKLTSTVSCNFSYIPPTGNLRVHLLLVEDSVTGVGHGYDQKSYFNSDASRPTLYHKGDTIKGYTHRHVVRLMPAGAYGKNGYIPSAPEVNKPYSYTFSNLDIPKKWKEKDLKVIAFVGYYNADKMKRQILNSNETTIFESINAGIAKPETQPTFIGIYPNPATTQVSVLFDARHNQNWSLEVYNIEGKKIYTTSGNQSAETTATTTINTTNFTKGIYLIKLQNNSGVVTQKLVIE
ncbi:MAG: T9SS type A sorting domain-containing protein [Bacteroidetes bacterium]|nr:T9SS type A sorting domain-containing protein [Bacteroidota bacterium]